MRTRQAGRRTIGRVALLASLVLLSGCTFEQILIGQIYTIQTPRAGSCPSLTWQFVVNAQRMIAGTLSDGGQQVSASLSGVLNPDDSFHITATEAGRGTADVTGQFTSQVSTISIQGNAAGAACDGQTFRLRLGNYLWRQGGGGGGDGS